MMGLAALLLTTWAACSDDTDASGGENLSRKDNG